MAIFRLNVENDNLHNAELIIAKETDIELESYLESWLENSRGHLSKENPFSGLADKRVPMWKKVTCSASIPRGNLVIVELKRARLRGKLSHNYSNTRHGQKNFQMRKFME